MRRLHTEALCWLRFGKRLPIVCTEVGPWHADVLGISDKMVVEVEIKKSKSDLRADFRNKKTKHFTYSEAEKFPGQFVPNYLYYYVPQGLKEYALKVIAEEAPKAGLAVQMETNYLDGRNTEIVKKPIRLRATPPAPGFVRMAMQRMSSELCGRHVVYDELVSRITSSFETIEQSALDTVIRVTGMLDSEDLLADQRRRAAELAFAIESVTDFGSLPIEQQQKWLTAATRWLEAQYVNSEEWKSATHRIGS
jgi:hypothetical protein